MVSLGTPDKSKGPWGGLTIKDGSAYHQGYNYHGTKALLGPATYTNDCTNHENEADVNIGRSATYTNDCTNHENEADVNTGRSATYTNDCTNHENEVDVNMRRSGSQTNVGLSAGTKAVNNVESSHGQTIC